MAAFVMTAGVVALVAYVLNVVERGPAECGMQPGPQAHPQATSVQLQSRAHLARRVSRLRAEDRAIRTMQADRRWSSR